MDEFAHIKRGNTAKGIEQGWEHRMEVVLVNILQTIERLNVKVYCSYHIIIAIFTLL